MDAELQNGCIITNSVTTKIKMDTYTIINILVLQMMSDFIVYIYIYYYYYITFGRFLLLEGLLHKHSLNNTNNTTGVLTLYISV